MMLAGVPPVGAAIVDLFWICEGGQFAPT